MDVTSIPNDVRVDRATMKGSVIDVIRMVNPNVGSNAGRDLQRTLEQFPELVPKVNHVRINGAGRETPVADAATLVEIVWLLPGRAAREFRRTSAQTVCRALGGDLTMAAEIEARHHALQSTPDGQAAAAFLAPPAPPSSSMLGTSAVSTVPGEMQLATQAQKEQYVDLFLQEKALQLRRSVLDATDDIRAKRMRLLQSSYELMQSLGGLDQRDVIEFQDRARTLLQFNAEEHLMPGSSPPTETSIVSAADTSSYETTPTPLCPAHIRGPETSIHVVSAKLGRSVGRRAGEVGKAIKRLYRVRYGNEAADSIPKRRTQFAGKPFLECTYYTRDEDLIEQALQEVLGAAAAASTPVAIATAEPARAIGSFFAPHA